MANLNPRSAILNDDIAHSANVCVQIFKQTVWKDFCLSMFSSVSQRSQMAKKKFIGNPSLSYFY